jgi:hypothetical protein
MVSTLAKGNAERTTSPSSGSFEKTRIAATERSRSVVGGALFSASMFARASARDFARTETRLIAANRADDESWISVVLPSSDDGIRSTIAMRVQSSCLMIFRIA